MKSEFADALMSENRNVNMPEEMDWFGALIGDWDMIWRQDIGTEREFVCKGEWIFSRVLNGFGIQDLFIVPSREERIRLNMPDAEYLVFQFSAVWTNPYSVFILQFQKYIICRFSFFSLDVAGKFPFVIYRCIISIIYIK